MLGSDRNTTRQVVCPVVNCCPRLQMRTLPKDAQAIDLTADFAPTLPLHSPMFQQKGILLPAGKFCFILSSSAAAAAASKYCHLHSENLACLLGDSIMLGLRYKSMIARLR